MIFNINYNIPHANGAVNTKMVPPPCNVYVTAGQIRYPTTLSDAKKGTM